MFASGIFIDSFSPKDEMQTNCMVNAIKAFKCNIVIVVDDKRLELSIQHKLKNSDCDTLVLFISKPQGVTNSQTDADHLYSQYFRGKNYDLMQRKEKLEERVREIKLDVDKQSKNDLERSHNINSMNQMNAAAHQMDAEMFLLDLKRNINEFQTQDIRIALEPPPTTALSSSLPGVINNEGTYKIFEIKCNIIPLHALPADAKEPRLDTEFERIQPAKLFLDVNKKESYKRRIAAVMLPRDAEEIASLENQMQLDKTDPFLEQKYNECLKKCICLELVQIKGFHETLAGPLPDEDSGTTLMTQTRQTQKFLEVTTTMSNQAITENKLSSNILFIG